MEGGDVASGRARRSAADVTASDEPTLIALHGVGVTIAGATILDDVDLEVAAGEHLVVLGPNGSGKTTLLTVMATQRYPTRGTARVLGMTFGRGDLRALRPRIGFVSIAVDPLLRVRAAVLPLVAAAVRGVTWPGRDALDDPGVVAAAQRALLRTGASHLADRRFDTLSQGERQRVRIARALAVDPDLLLLDEPFAGLDLGGRETLLTDLDALLAEPDGPTVVLVTHHLEEVPTGVACAVLLRDARIVAAGAVDAVLADAPVSAAFDLDVEVARHDGRFAARVARATTRPAPPT